MQSRTPVSERALVARLNRRLNRDNQRIWTVRRCAGGYEDSNLGRYCILNTYRNTLIRSRVNIEELGRDLKVLGENEFPAQSVR